MKNQIFYTVSKVYESTDPNFNKFVTIPLARITDKSYFQVNESLEMEYFNSLEECFFYIKEICKPNYYNLFGSNYELVYLDVDSQEWNNIFNNWITPQEFYNSFCKKKWYKKLLRSLISLFGR